MKGPAPPLEVYEDEPAGRRPAQQQQQQQALPSAAAGAAPPRPAARTPLQASQAPVAAWLRAVQWAEEHELDAELPALLTCGNKRTSDRTVATYNQARVLIGSQWSFVADGRARAAYALYQRTLRAVLRARAAGGGRTAAGRAAAVRALLERTEVTAGLVHACMEAVHFAFLADPAEGFPWLTLRLRRAGSCWELWLGLQAVAERGGAPGGGPGAAAVPAAPPELRAYLGAAAARCVEQLVLRADSSIFAAMASMSAAALPAGAAAELALPPAAPGVADDVFAFLAAAGRAGQRRAAELAAALLAARPELAAADPDFAAHVGSVVDAVLHRHVQVVFNAHLAVAVAGCAYFVARLAGVVLPFRELTAVAAALPLLSAEVFADVDLPGERGGGGGGGGESRPPPAGDSRAFYNAVLLPLLEGYPAGELLAYAPGGSSPDSSPGGGGSAGADGDSAGWDDDDVTEEAPAPAGGQRGGPRSAAPPAAAAARPAAKPGAAAPFAPPRPALGGVDPNAPRPRPKA